nr:hypothetical protein [Tanacetum cinerariifolium]
GKQLVFNGVELVLQQLLRLLKLLQRDGADNRLLGQGFERIADHRFLFEQLLAHLFELTALDEQGLIGLPTRGGLLLAVAHQPLGILAVTFALAQVHLNEALDNKRIEDSYLRNAAVQVVG